MTKAHGRVRDRRMAGILWILPAVLTLGCPKKEPTLGAERKVAPPSVTARADPPGPPSLSPADSEATGQDALGLLARVQELLGVLARRTLTDSEKSERDAAATFVKQARQALESDGADRAIVLAEKARVLLEDLERATRP